MLNPSDLTTCYRCFTALSSEPSAINSPSHSPSDPLQKAQRAVRYCHHLPRLCRAPGGLSHSPCKCSFASRVYFTCGENGAALSMTDPIACDSLYKDSSRPASAGSRKPDYCGLPRTSRSSEKQTALPQTVVSGSQSASFAEGSFRRRLEKP